MNDARENFPLLESFSNFAEKFKVTIILLTTIICGEPIFLQSSIHNEWAWKYASTLETRIRYLNVDCIDTFPFPQNLTKSQEEQLERLGESYHEHRKQLMLAIHLGLTKTYNLFHAQPLRPMAPEEEQLDDKVLQKLLGKDAAHLRKHLAKTPGTITFNEAVSAIQKLRDLHLQMDNAVLEAYERLAQSH